MFCKNDHWRWNAVFSIWSGKETIKQWITATSLRLKEAHMTKSTIRTMLTTLFRISGIVHFEFAPQGQATRIPMQTYWRRYVKLCAEAGLNFDPTIGSSTSTTVQVMSCSVKQFMTRTHARTHTHTHTHTPTKLLLLDWHTSHIYQICLTMPSGSFYN